MRYSETVVIIYGKNIRNRIGDLMHRLGYFKIMHYVPVFDAGGNEIGIRATIKATGKISRFLIRRLFNAEGVSLEPVVLEKRRFEVL